MSGDVGEHGRPQCLQGRFVGEGWQGVHKTGSGGAPLPISRVWLLHIYPNPVFFLPLSDFIPPAFFAGIKPHRFMPTANMGLTEPTVGADNDTWGDELNDSLDLVDAHDHTTGKGVKVPTSGININADLEHNNYNLTEVKSVRFENQASNLASGSDLRCLYVKSNELYWNTSSGTAVKLTLGTGINSAGIATNAYESQSVSGHLTIDASDDFDLLLVSTASARNITLPLAANVTAGRRFIIKDITGSAATNNITIVRSGSDTIEGVSGNKTLQTNYGAWQIVSNGSNAWWLV